MPVRRQWPTLNQLDILVAIAREGSFTRAAGTLYLTEPAVSHQVKLLEARIGAQLFERAPRKAVRLTEAGRRMLLAGHSVFEGLDRAIQEVQALNRSEEGRIAFGSRAYFSDHLLPSLFMSFKHHNPAFEVQVDRGKRNYLLDSLRQGRLDVVVVDGAVDEPQLSSTQLAQLDMVLVGPPEHPLSNGEPAPFDALASERLIPRSQAFAVLSEVERKASNIGFSLQTGWEVGSMEAQIDAVRNGLGVALVPYPAVRPHLDAGTLSLLRIEGFPMRLGWFLVWRSKDVSAAAEAFIQHLLSERVGLDALCTAPPKARGDVSRSS